MATPKRGVSKAEWLEAALRALGEGSVAEISVQSLARSLGIAKAGFYWHFVDRDDLLGQLLDYWTHEFTEVVSSNPELLKLDPRSRLATTAERILDYDLAGYELAVRLWALRDPRAARAVRRVNRIRLDFIRQAFDELGFAADEAEMRSMLFACYHTFEAPMFREVSRKRRRALIASRVELLTKR